jgi:hypothetical protein
MDEHDSGRRHNKEDNAMTRVSCARARARARARAHTTCTLYSPAKECRLTDGAKSVIDKDENCHDPDSKGAFKEDLEIPGVEVIQPGWKLPRDRERGIEEIGTINSIITNATAARDAGARRLLAVFLFIG